MSETPRTPESLRAEQLVESVSTLVDAKTYGKSPEAIAEIYAKEIDGILLKGGGAVVASFAEAEPTKDSRGTDIFQVRAYGAIMPDHEERSGVVAVAYHDESGRVEYNLVGENLSNLLELAR